MSHKVDKMTGTVLRRLRDRAGLTQERVAASLGVSYQQLQKYETGKNRISVSRLFDLADVLNTEASDIIKLVEYELEGENLL